MSGWDLFFVLFLLLIYNVLLPAVVGKPSFSFFQQLASLSGYKQVTDDNEPNTTIVKPFSEYRVSNESKQMLYYHDQTIAIAEVGQDKELLSCELIETINPKDRKKTLMTLSQIITTPIHISFDDMMTFLGQCQMVNDYEVSTKSELSDDTTQVNFLPTKPLTILKGIVPGTKWCGTGDIASNYHDLGEEPQVDRCCRIHDICPVKIQANQSRYNLTNTAYYTKSHCVCDDMLYDCLKESSSQTAQIMGNVYFNIIQVQCIEETDKGRQFRAAKGTF